MKNAPADTKYLEKKTKSKFRCGFAALIGRPNTGKSTLTNNLVGFPITITADKPQTTRNNIRGIVTKESYQAILVDTPGIHEPANILHNRIVKYALETIKEADIVLMIAEPVTTSGGALKDDDRRVIEALKFAKGPVFLIMNKIDMYPLELMMKSTQTFMDAFPFQSSFPISALKNKGIQRLEKIFSEHLPFGNKLYPDDYVTSSPLRSIASEIIRESVFRFTSKEVPYSCAVEVEKFEEHPGLCKIFASIVVGRQSHKKILVGSQGSAVKRIGIISRKKIQMITYKKVYLALHVKVVENWYDDSHKLKEFGYV